MSPAIPVSASRRTMLMPIAGAGNDAAGMAYGSTRPAHNAAPTVTRGTGGAGGPARGADDSVLLRIACRKGLAIPFTRDGSR